MRARHRVRAENYLKAFWGLVWSNRPRYGGHLVHLAIVLIAIGIIGSSFYKAEKEVTLMPGESMTIEHYTLTYENLDQYETESRVVATTTLSVYIRGKLIGKLTPEKYFHRSYEQPVTEVAIRTSLIEDLYVILIGWYEDGSTTFKVLVNPVVSWIWIGGGVLVLGGLLAFWPERRKILPPRHGETTTSAASEGEE
jgi:cytochrome c-type biogenesis protein CcmF